MKKGLRPFGGSIAALLIVWLACSHRHPAPLPEPYSHIPLDYEQLLERAKLNDTTLDFTALRFAYSQTDAYQPYRSDLDVTEQRMWQAADDEDYTGALKYAREILTKVYIDIDAHFIAWGASSVLDMNTERQHHFYMFSGLVRSVLSSGDGESEESAYIVICVDEEYSLLRAFQCDLEQQALLITDWGEVDQMTVTSYESGEHHVLYFNVSIPFGWLSRNSEVEQVWRKIVSESD